MAIIVAMSQLFGLRNMFVAIHDPNWNPLLEETCGHIVCRIVHTICGGFLKWEYP